MKLIEFLEQAEKNTFWTSNFVFCFRGDEYPVLFFRLFWDCLKERNIVSFSFLPIDEKMQLMKALQQSFLGASFFYWLGSVGIKENKKKKELDVIELLSLYRGPHTVAFFVPSAHEVSRSVMQRVVFVDLEKGMCDARQAAKVISFLGNDLSLQKMAVAREIIESVKEVSLDIVCLLSYYLSVTNAKFVPELKRNMLAIIDPELSLSLLSSLFFRKDKREFFLLWSKRCNDYTIPFWTTYWGEQLWRAYHVVKFLKESNFPAAKRFAYRLPASFINGDWKQCSLDELEQAYKMVYDIDFFFKNGSTFCAFDVFYSSYFLGKFV